MKYDFYFISCVIIVLIAIYWILFAVYYCINNWDPKPICHCCGGETEPEWICDRCEQFYCDNCSAPFTYMTQIDYPCCEDCYNVYYE